MTSIFVSIWLIRTSILEWKGYMFFTIQMGTWKFAKISMFCCCISSKMKKSTQKEAKKGFLTGALLCFDCKKLDSFEVLLSFFPFHTVKISLFKIFIQQHLLKARLNFFKLFFHIVRRVFTAMQLPPTNGPNLNVCQTSWEDSHVMEVFAFSNTSVRVSLFTPTELCRKGSFQWKV